jgi:hypothetical protein
MKTTAMSWMLLLLGACTATQGEGERCNPLRATSDCADGLSCVYPTGPMCGVSYCCAIDEHGNIVDRDPNCQPDPASAMECGLDLSMSGPSQDLSSRD